MLHSKVYALVVIVLSRKSCQIHNKKHSTSLDDNNWRLEEVKTEGRSSQHEKPAKGNSVTKASDIPIIMGIVPVCFYQKDNPNKLSP